MLLNDTVKWTAQRILYYSIAFTVHDLRASRVHITHDAITIFHLDFLLLDILFPMLLSFDLLSFRYAVQILQLYTSYGKAAILRIVFQGRVVLTSIYPLESQFLDTYSLL